MTETKRRPARQSFEALLDQDWEKIILYPAAGKHVPDMVEANTLAIVVDPEADLTATSELEEGAKLVVINQKVTTLTEKLDGRVDCAILEAPDPREAEDIIFDLERLIKPEGGIVVRFDTSSNLRHLVSGAMDSIRKNEMLDDLFEIFIHDPEIDEDDSNFIDLDEIHSEVGIGSDIIPDIDTQYVRALLLIKKST